MSATDRGRPRLRLRRLPERQTSIAVAGKTNGFFYIDLVDSRRSTSWLVARELELKQLYKATFVCDAYGPTASLIPALEEAGVEVNTVTANEHAQACARFIDAIEERNLLLLALRRSLERRTRRTYTSPR